jgi:RNA polymerase sigma-70 factor, ECF subfamily
LATILSQPPGLNPSHYDAIFADGGIGERTAHHEASKLVKVNSPDFDVIKQDLLIEILEQLPKFNPSRASLKTFIGHVVHYKVCKIRAHRNDCHRVASLDSKLSGRDDGRSITLGETLSDDADRRRGRNPTPDELSGLGLDLEGTIASLKPEHRDLCERLKTDTVTEIARELKASRGTLYEAIKQIRAAFERDGLSAYLPDHAG